MKDHVRQVIAQRIQFEQAIINGIGRNAQGPVKAAGATQPQQHGNVVKLSDLIIFDYERYVVKDKLIFQGVSIDEQCQKKKAAKDKKLA